MFLIGLIIIFSITNFITSQMTVRVEKTSLTYLSDIVFVKWAQEYLPLSASNYSFNLKDKQQDLSVDKGNATIEIIKNNVPNMEFSVENIKGEIEVEFPRIYYLGYKLTDKQGREYELAMNSNGLLQAKISKNGEYRLEYVGTKGEKYANIVTIISIITFILYLFMLKFYRKRRDNL